VTPAVAPLVSIVTPVYNGEKFLVECIESVLGQTYSNFEYLIVNNGSKDRTLEIAQSYAKKDSRIRVHDNVEFLAVIANHNHAFGLISPSAKYCKVVSGDDFIMPDCIRQMVVLAEANPTVGIVGSYQQSGERVRWQGFPYPQSVFTGRELCRKIFLGNKPDFGFGSPSSLLYRADLVRSTREFYPNPSPHSDTSACFAAMQHCDFGFIYQVISGEITHNETQSSTSARMNRYSSACLNDLQQYGPSFLSEEELHRAVQQCLDDYHRFLAVNYFVKSQGKDFWNYHRGRLEELGHPLKFAQLGKAIFALALKGVLNPERAFKNFRDSKKQNSPVNPPLQPAAKKTQVIKSSPRSQV
jgi:glycosyltransferase involved in cell wall biosynthesis